jgi:hypothetical protein
MIDRLLILQGGPKHTGDAHPKMTTKTKGAGACINQAVPSVPQFGKSSQSWYKAGRSRTPPPNHTHVPHGLEHGGPLQD